MPGQYYTTDGQVVVENGRITSWWWSITNQDTGSTCLDTWTAPEAHTIDVGVVESSGQLLTMSTTQLLLGNDDAADLYANYGICLEWSPTQYLVATGDHCVAGVEINTPWPAVIGTQTDRLVVPAGDVVVFGGSASSGAVAVPEPPALVLAACFGLAVLSICLVKFGVRQ